MADRISAMRYRVMATLLDNPEEALEACRLCLEELHAMPVHKSFNVQLKQGMNKFKCWFNRTEREEIITWVCRVNRVIFYVSGTGR